MLNRVLQTRESRRAPSRAGQMEFLRIPSISARPESAGDMLVCAEWLAGQLRAAGLETGIHATPGHPIVVARNQHKPGRPTVLFYGHYDVQPPEPLDLWTTPPFDPTLRDDGAGHLAIHARGAVDDKGQVWCHVEALRAWHAHGGPPINLIALIEGEEEVGSDHLEQFVREHKADLKADIALISDTNQFARGAPAITYGLRGLCYMEVFLTGPDHDLHSGLYGGAVPNPANVLCRLLGSLHHADGRVHLPGFYDEVIDLRDDERAMWRSLPFSEDDFAASVGIPAASGEAGYTALERTWARPTCDVNGITAGYQGPGAKTVIPSKASAKVSMRLVPNQDPAAIQAIFERTLRQRCPSNVKIRFAQHGLADPVLVPIDSPAMQRAAQAVEAGFAARPTFIRSGGSIPVVALIKKTFGIDTLLVGFGLPDDRVHSPNEKFDLDAFHAGARTAAALYQQLAELAG